MSGGLAGADVVEPCFHCGEAVPPINAPVIIYQENTHAVCCLGCQAVATTIIDGGFDAYYRRRTAWAQSRNTDGDDDGYAHYDDPGFQRRFVLTLENGEHEVVLALDGMHCASCVWLAEHALARQSGVASFTVNMMTHRARLRWQPSGLSLSTALRALAAVGLPAEPYDQARRDERIERERRRSFRQLFIAGLGMMQVMMYVLPHYVAGDAVEPEFQRLMQWASLWMTLPVVCYSALPMLQGAWRDLQQKRLGMDVPVALAIVVAFVASVWHTWLGQGEVYFDSITMFVFLLLCGRKLEAGARSKAVDALDDFLRLRPQHAQRINADQSRESVPVEDLRIGDRIEVGSSDMLPSDGLLCSPRAELDLSLLTGESLPVTRLAGDRLPSGAVNCGAPIEIELNCCPADNALSVIGRLIDRAAAEKPRIARLADQAARVFLFALLITTAVVTLIWWQVDAARALPIAISLLVVSCPCALSLAMPAALAAATGSLARRGVLVARADAIEALSRIDEMAFDKTGTLTLARSVLTRVEPAADLDADQVLCLAAALEQGSGHPLGRAIVDAAAGFALPVVSGRRLEAGSGVEGLIDGVIYRIGQAGFVVPGANPRSEAGMSCVAFGDTKRILAWFHLQAPLRRGALELAPTLASLGLKLRLLSGDRSTVVHAMAQRLSISEAQGDLTPAGKLEAIQKLQAAGHRVAMIGDGINDAPVLAAADVSVALGDGTELAQVSADVILMSGDLGALAEAVRLSRRAIRIMRQNLWWAASYNLLAIPVAALGWINPWQSALGMSLSSLLVVANALRLLERHPHRGR